MIHSLIAEEVHRQGYKRETAIHTEMCINMARAWERAIMLSPEGPPRTHDARDLGSLVEPQTNAQGFRMCGVRVGLHIFPEWTLVNGLMNKLFAAIREERISAQDAYIEFEEIHPFGDGNGRTGKILFNWINGTLMDPVFPENTKGWVIP